MNDSEDGSTYFKAVYSLESPSPLKQKSPAFSSKLFLPI